MECQKDNCNIVANERMIFCWLCLGNYHLKCTTLKARDADSLGDPAKSIQWTCPRCKPINLDFYKFFKSYKDEFDQLNKDFLSIQVKLSEFGELFTKFPNLDNFGSAQGSLSPKRKKTYSKSPIIPEITFSGPLNPADKNKNNCIPMRTELINHDSSPSTPLNSFPLQDIIKAVPDTDNTSRNTVILPAVLPDNSQIVHNPLRAIPPKKSIFISRLASDTTPDDVNYYIKSKIESSPDVIIHKFQYLQPRSISSFKITVPDDLFQQILDSNFWPTNTLVREYIHKERRNSTNVGVLPQRVENISKN